jgi:hypothetical protein
VFGRINLAIPLQHADRYCNFPLRKAHACATQGTSITDRHEYAERVTVGHFPTRLGAGQQSRAGRT